MTQDSVLDGEPLLRAEKLKSEADEVLQLLRLPEILKSYGGFYPSGSYSLNVMVYPDIDLYITKVSVEQIFSIGAKIAHCESVIQVVYEPSDDPVNLPGGLYLKARVNYGQWGRPWKVDIWSLSEDVIMQKMTEMEHFQQCMTAEMRRLIIRYKFSIMTSQHRTPMYSGYYIYKAFLDEGMTDFDDVSCYLKANGIKFEG